MIIKSIPLIAIFYLFNRIGYIYRLIDLPISDSIFPLFKNMKYIAEFPMITFHPFDLLWGIVPIIFVIGVIKIKTSNKKKYRHGEEYGSARWGTQSDIKPYKDNNDEDNNIILTQTEGLRMNGRPSHPKHDRNKNVLVVGGSGSGKTRFFIKPNLMQRHSSYVVTDPKGSVLTECGVMLRRKEQVYENGKLVVDTNGNPILENYNIKVFNTINFNKSMKYNPLAYIKSERDVLKFVNVLIMNTKGEGDKAGEDFWVKAERLYFMALVGYIIFELPPIDHNFNTLLDLINMSETREDDENFKNPVDLLFEAVENQDSFCVRQYKKYKMAAGKTAKSILISVGARLSVFDILELREITSSDEMELEKLGGYQEELVVNKQNIQLDDLIIKINGKQIESNIKVNKKNIEEIRQKGEVFTVNRINKKKTALFIIIDDTDASFNFLVAIMYSQMFNILSNKADDEFGGRLPIHVRCLIDEFANIGQIPNFEKLIATIRSRGISACIVLQTRSQLKGIYKDHADTIVGNCDSQIFLGGTEETTLKAMSETLGKETIDQMNTSMNYAQQKTHGQNYQKLGRELMSKDELSVMDGGKCILQLRGVRPFFSNKYDIVKHKRYKYLDEANKKYIFDVERYIANSVDNFQKMKEQANYEGATAFKEKQMLVNNQKQVNEMEEIDITDLMD